MFKVRFSASGYGTTTETYSTREQAKAAIENEAEDVLADHNSDPERASLAGGHRVFASRHSFRLEVFCTEGRPHFLFSGNVCLEAHPRLFCKRGGLV